MLIMNSLFSEMLLSILRVRFSTESEFGNQRCLQIPYNFVRFLKVILNEEDSLRKDI